MSHGGCFCRYCMEGFRSYLAESYSSDQLYRMGIDSIRDFDYRDLVLEHANTRTIYVSAFRRNEIPLQEDVVNFQLKRDRELFKELKRYAAELRAGTCLFPGTTKFSLLIGQTSTLDGAPRFPGLKAMHSTYTTRASPPLEARPAGSVASQM
jgi:hypothetical protein